MPVYSKVRVTCPTLRHRIGEISIPGEIFTCVVELAIWEGKPLTAARLRPIVETQHPSAWRGLIEDGMTWEVLEMNLNYRKAL